MNETERKVLEKISPTEEYRIKLKEILKEIKIEINKEIEKRNLPVEIILVGSIAKDTYLMNNMDIDFFLCFPTNFAKEKISENSLSIGKNILEKTEESYAEHPYIRGYFKNYYVEIVPCYKIENAKQKLSAVDRTPLHTEYIVKNLKETQKKEVRLFKQFLKGINCYGAEAQIQGFSGYLCEILILYYDSFENLIKNASKWKKGKKISLEKNTEVIHDFDTPLVFIDPVDPERNVASALIYEKFKLFKKASKEYLKKPKIKFFFPNPVEPWPLEKIEKEIEKQDAKYIGVRINKPDMIDENLYPQIRKAENSIKDACKRNDFKIQDSKFFIDGKNKDIYIIFKTDKEDLSKTRIHQGPPLKMGKNVKDFREKWKNNDRLVKFITEKNRINVEIKRRYARIEDFLEDNLSDLSLGSKLDKVANRKFEILERKNLIKNELRLFWAEYLDNKYSWER